MISAIFFSLMISYLFCWTFRVQSSEYDMLAGKKYRIKENPFLLTRHDMIKTVQKRSLPDMNLPVSITQKELTELLLNIAPVRPVFI